MQDYAACSPTVLGRMHEGLGFAGTGRQQHNLVLLILS